MKMKKKEKKKPRGDLKTEKKSATEQQQSWLADVRW